MAALARTRKTGPWTQGDMGLLKRVYGTRSNEDLAILFGRRLEEVETEAKRLCLGKDKAFLRRKSGGRQATRMPFGAPLRAANYFTRQGSSRGHVKLLRLAHEFQAEANLGRSFFGSVERRSQSCPLTRAVVPNCTSGSADSAAMARCTAWGSSAPLPGVA